MRHLSLALGVMLVWACGTAKPPDPTPTHIRQSTRQLNLAAELYIKGCYAGALAHYQQAHERFTAADQLVGIAYSLMGIANVYYRTGELPSAVLAYDDAIEVFGLMGDPAGSVRAMSNKSAALVAAGQLSEAQTLLDRADQLAKGQKLLPALRLKTRAILSMERQKAQDARKLLQQAIAAAKENASDQLSSANYAMGRLLLNEQHPAQAIAFLEKSLALDRERGAYDDTALDLAALGQCYAQLEQPPKAIAYYKRSIKIFALLGNAAQVQRLAKMLEVLRPAADRRTEATMHWVHQWLNGQKEANLCR